MVDLKSIVVDFQKKGMQTEKSVEEITNAK